MIYGTPTFVALWVGAGVTGAISSLVLQKERRGVDQQFIGASGSVMGLSAAYACAFPFAKMLIFPFVSTLSCRTLPIGGRLIEMPRKAFSDLELGSVGGICSI